MLRIIDSGQEDEDSGRLLSRLSEVVLARDMVALLDDLYPEKSPRASADFEETLKRGAVRELIDLLKVHLSE